MIARTESVQNWLENITHQMCNMVRIPHTLPLPLGICHQDISTDVVPRRCFWFAVV